eukprot:1054303-Prorocentrum_minimum.AAC.5
MLSFTVRTCLVWISRAAQPISAVNLKRDSIALPQKLVRAFAKTSRPLGRGLALKVVRARRSHRTPSLRPKPGTESGVRVARDDIESGVG